MNNKKKMESMNKHATLDLYYTLLESNDLLEEEKKTIFRKHNNIFIQIGSTIIHFHIYSTSIFQEPTLNIIMLDPLTLTPIHTYNPTLYKFKMIYSMTSYDFQKIILEIPKLRNVP
jgi:hypothetical protein